jgi:hypothetical protein
MKLNSPTVGFRLPFDTFELLSRRARMSVRSSGDVARSLVENGLTGAVEAELSALRESVLALQGQVRDLARTMQKLLLTRAPAVRLDRDPNMLANVSVSSR